MANCNNLIVDGELVDKILEQGQRLRNSMIESILNNDPLNKEIIYYDTQIPTDLHNTDKVDQSKLEAYLRGESMTKDEEIEAFRTIQKLSVKQLSQLTNRIFCSKCKCRTCLEYDGTNFNCDNIVTQQIQEKYSKENSKFYKYVDSLKISVHSLILNEAGNRKVGASDRNQVPLNQTYFLEYKLSNLLIKNDKVKSKVDSGLENNGVVRICSRRRSNEDITFRQISIHDVDNICTAINENISITFNINYRNSKQKSASRLGCAKFYFSTFDLTRNLTCNRGLIVQLNDSTPVVLGVLKISVQLGCGRLYFGKEFLQAVNTDNTKSIVLDSDDSACQSEKSAPIVHKRNERMTKEPPKNEQKSKKNILFGFIYISEVNYLSHPINSYITCRPFCQDNVFSSRIVLNNSSPVFNFCQVIPLILDEDLLLKFRENYTLVEFWKKTGLNKDVVIGLAKIPLQQFYTTFRNPLIIKYLENNKLPTIGTDWWEPIQSADDELIGQAQILVALGTEQQIQNLEFERGFKTNPVKAKFQQPLKAVKSIDSTQIRTVNVATQFSPAKMEDESAQQNSEALSLFLNELMSKNKTVVREKSTNTECSTSENTSQIRKTSELLDNLEKVISLQHENVETNQSFKAQVLIESALHLPCRKRSKSKKSKSKNCKFDVNLLPSTYVTFEANSETKFTQIVSKSCEPKWNYKCDVSLSSDLLTNNNNRLIFKVWRKSSNTVKLPNLQTDMVLGFAALDLTVLLAGLPNVQGWFNITDFSKKCNGQINIHITPLEDLGKFQSQREPISDNATATSTSETPETELLDEPGELLSRALKRKFTELDEITQRLRLRLSKVTNDDESDNSNDEIADEFERDINTLCVEDDFNLINFDEDTKMDSNNKTNQYVSLMEIYENKDTSSSSSGPLNGLDTHLVEGKQRIDSLLEKLSILSGDVGNQFTSRYVSGCSTSHENNSNVDVETILKQLDHSSRPNIHASVQYDQAMFQQLFTNSTENSDSNENSVVSSFF